MLSKYRNFGEIHLSLKTVAIVVCRVYCYCLVWRCETIRNLKKTINSHIEACFGGWIYNYNSITYVSLALKLRYYILCHDAVYLLLINYIYNYCISEGKRGLNAILLFVYRHEVVKRFQDNEKKAHTVLLHCNYAITEF